MTHTVHQCSPQKVLSGMLNIYIRMYVHAYIRHLICTYIQCITNCLQLVTYYDRYTCANMHMCAVSPGTVVGAFEGDGDGEDDGEDDNDGDGDSDDGEGEGEGDDREV